MTPQELERRAKELAGVTSELVLKRVGVFLPFGISVTATGEKKTYMMQGGAGDAAQFKRQVHDTVRAEALAGKVSAVALACPVEVTHPTLGRVVKAICVQVESRGHHPSVSFRTYTKGMFGMKFGEPFATHEPPPFERVFI